MKKSHITRNCVFLFLAFITLSCYQQKTSEQANPTSVSLSLEEIKPGLLKGYLKKSEFPNSLALLPPPPEEGSIAWQLDQEKAAYYVALKDSARTQLAAQDAVLAFPAALKAFNSILPKKISEENTPNAYLLMRRTLTDLGLSTYAAKDHYKRPRPFMINDTPICTPEDEEALRGDGSYPSGHTAIGWGCIWDTT